MAGKTITDVIGSDLEAFRKDENGKTRTPEEIIKAAIDKGLKEIAPENRGSDTSDTALTNTILAQLKSNAQRNAPNTSISADVYKALGGASGKPNIGKYLSDKSNWKYGNQVGQVIDRGEGNVPGLVLDRSQKFISKEDLARIQQPGGTPSGTAGLADPSRFNYVDPVTGFGVDVNPFTGEINWDSVDTNTFMNQGSPGSGPYKTGGAYGVGGGSFSSGYNQGGDPSSLTAGDGTQFDNFSNYLTYQNKLDANTQERKSAYDLLYAQFKQYGLESLVEPLKDLITSNTPPSEFVIKLRETEAYKKRFAGNAERIKKGLAAISEAEYIGLEDQYQNIMRNYGLPDKYWAKDAMGTQQGFTNFIGNDVSAIELEDRIMNAQNRVVTSNPEVSAALKQFYPEITNGDILAYTLDPTKGLEDIKRKITAAEIGGAAIQSGLQTSLTRAEELRKYGINKDTAQQGYGAIGSSLQRGSQLASIYGENPYTQTTAEQEVFKIPGAEDARKQRQKITGLERAAFSGQTGLTSGALARDRAGNY